MKRNLTRPVVYFIGSLSLLAFAFTISSSTSKNTMIKWKASLPDSSGVVLVKNPNGPTLGYSTKSGVKILTVDGLAFKDLNKNGRLDKYEDWRLPVAERADGGHVEPLRARAGLNLDGLHLARPVHRQLDHDRSVLPTGFSDN